MGRCVPNNVYGYGRIDALRTIRGTHELFLSKTAPVAVFRVSY
jgi:hypothetical protein